jgi:hypothetical protein
MIAFAVALLCVGLVPQGPSVQEREPNDSPQTATQDVAPGATVTGSLPSGDEDWFHVVCAEPTMCSFTLETEAAGSPTMAILLPQGRFAVRTDDRPLRTLCLQLPGGRTAVQLAGQAGSYQLRITATSRGLGKELEPNDREADATPIREGETIAGQHSGWPNEEDFFVFEVGAAGPRELVLSRNLTCERPLRGTLSVYRKPPTLSYSYDITLVAAEFHFYPVFDPGTWYIEFNVFGDTAVGEPYELSLLPVSPRIAAEERVAGAAAVDRAVRWLSQLPESRAKNDFELAAEGMVLAALAEGRGGRERREQLERDYVDWIEGFFRKIEGGTWRDRDVSELGTNIYAHTMATLGLAEAAAIGSTKARALATRAAEFLIATQNTERKPAHWGGPISRMAPGHGGWRYAPEEPSADLSILGWAVIALSAVDAAGIEIEGMREAIAASLGYVNRVGDENGFGYTNPGGNSNVHNSIGALLLLLHDESATGLGYALHQLDRHLWSATQVDHGDGVPFYYLYYATRAQYLRRGEAWETWRATALRQLLRRQNADGSWAAIHYESQPGPRWTTALGLLVLRLCLDEAPRYLRVEAKGF